MVFDKFSLLEILLLVEFSNVISFLLDLVTNSQNDSVCTDNEQS